MLNILNLNILLLGIFLGGGLVFLCGWWRKRYEIGDIHIEVNSLKDVDIRLPKLNSLKGLPEEDRRNARLILAAAIKKLSQAIENTENESLGLRYS